MNWILCRRRIFLGMTIRYTRIHDALGLGLVSDFDGMNEWMDEWMNGMELELMYEIIELFSSSNSMTLIDHGHYHDQLRP